MSDFKDRLAKELEELELKHSKLEAFKESDKFDEIDPLQQSLLNIQCQAMGTYGNCLFERIKWLNKAES